MDEVKWEKAIVVGHSFGSVMAGWTAKHIPHRLSHLCLVDAINVGLFWPMLCYRVLYKTPRRLYARLAKGLVLGDPAIARLLWRDFWWFLNILWPEDLIPAPGASPLPVTVIIAEHDPIIDTPFVDELVRRDGLWPNQTVLRLMHFSGLFHGTAVFDRDAIDLILRAVFSPPGLFTIPSYMEAPTPTGSRTPSKRRSREIVLKRLHRRSMSNPFVRHIAYVVREGMQAVCYPPERVFPSGPASPKPNEDDLTIPR